MSYQLVLCVGGPCDGKYCAIQPGKKSFDAIIPVDYDVG